MIQALVRVEPSMLTHSNLRTRRRKKNGRYEGFCGKVSAVNIKGEKKGKMKNKEASPKRGDAENLSSCYENRGRTTKIKKRERAFDGVLFYVRESFFFLFVTFSKKNNI